LETRYYDFSYRVKCPSGQTQLHIADELDSKREIPQMPYEIAVNNKKVNKSLIAVADKKKNCVRIFDKEGKFVRKLGC